MSSPAPALLLQGQRMSPQKAKAKRVAEYNLSDISLNSHESSCIHAMQSLTLESKQQKAATKVAPKSGGLLDGHSPFVCPEMKKEKVSSQVREQTSSQMNTSGLKKEKSQVIENSGIVPTPKPRGMRLKMFKKARTIRSDLTSVLGSKKAQEAEKQA